MVYPRNSGAAVGNRGYYVKTDYQENPITALYARLSKDDKLQGESQNQKRILETYARDNGLMNYRFFVDDGWSGAIFQRPGFMEMMDCIENGEVKCAITKNLQIFYTFIVSLSCTG